jgi:hypothetical protein
MRSAKGAGFDPEHTGSFAAFLVADRVEVKRFETPSDVRDPDGYELELELPERPVELVPELVLPDCFSDETRTLFGHDQFDSYWDVRDDVLDEIFHRAPRHRVCGLPDIMQNPMDSSVSWRVRASTWVIRRAIRRRGRTSSRPARMIGGSWRRSTRTRTSA